MIRLAIFFLLISFSSLSQNSLTDIKKLEFSNENKEKLAEENIYIQTDKEIYKPSEIIWFKAYILDSKTLLPSIRNRTLYVQLTNTENASIVIEKKFEIINGFCNGDLFIEEDIDTGNYNIAAYTASSILQNELPVSSYKSINIKKTSLDKVFMDYFFDKAYYSNGDLIKLDLNFYDNSGSDLAGYKVLVNYLNDGKSIKKERLVTNENGIIKLELSTNDKSKEITDLEFSISRKNINKRFKVEIPVKEASKISLGLFPEGGKLIAGLNNKLAFKAIKRGKPISIKGELLENNVVKKLLNSFHDGMGYVNFIPKKNASYKIRVTEPEEQYFDLPSIESEGIGLSFLRETNNNLVFRITKTEDLGSENLSLRVQAKTIIYKQIIFEYKKGSVIVKLPKNELPKGVLEVTLYDSKLQPISERLVFNKSEELLNMTNQIGIEDVYKTKDKITLKLKTTDNKGNPTQAHLGLRVFDNVHSNANDEKNIVTHYHFSSELKGSINNPLFYFSKETKNRSALLDLLMLTHGWRNYVYSKTNLDSIQAKNNEKLKDKVIAGILRTSSSKVLEPLNEPLDVKLVYPSTIISKSVEKDGLLEIPLLTNNDVFVKLPDDKKYFLKMPNHFKSLNTILEFKDFKKTSIVRVKNTNFDKDFLRRYYASGNILDEVLINTSKSRNAYKDGRTNKRIFPGQGDYVCMYNILNCINHTVGGVMPIEGETYRLNTGARVIYRLKKLDETDFDKATKGFGYIEGYEFKKEFYKVDYDNESKNLINFMDNRTTLAWEPNLITDENGIAEFSFFTSDVSSSFTIHVEGVDLKGNLGSIRYNFRVR